MEVADFVAESEEEEEEEGEGRGLLGERAHLPADDEEQSWRADSSRLRMDGERDGEREVTEIAAALSPVVSSVARADTDYSGTKETAVSALEQIEKGEGSIQVDDMDVEVVQDSADDEDAHGSDADNSDHEHEEQGAESDEIAVGSVVEVEARTWPGINKLGGAGRVTAIHREVADDGQTEQLLYDVRYLFGGFDKRVESEFVQLLWKVHKDAKRRNKQREFYHDQYINEPQKKKLKVDRTSRRTPSHAHKPSRTPAKSSPAPTVVETSSIRELASLSSPFSDDDGVSSDNEHEDVPKVGVVGLQHLDDSAFLLNRASRAMSRDGPSSDSSSRLQTDVQHKKKRDLKRKRETEEAGAVSSDDPSIVGEDDARAGHMSDGADQHGGRRAKRKRERSRRHHRESIDRPAKTKTSGRKRKQRYVGGYHHGGDDPDAMFIQPEDNPSALPEDVARETQFVLADTKAGLRKQVNERWALFKANLAKLAQEKASAQARMRNLSGASVDEIRDLYRTLSELYAFITSDVIRGGVDVLNDIFKELDRRSITIEEQMALEFDQLVRESNADSSWAFSAKKSVEDVFKHLHGGAGARLEFDKEDSSEASDSSDSRRNSDSSVEVHTVDNDIADFVSNGYDTGYFDAEEISVPRRRRLEDGSRLARGRLTLERPPGEHSGKAKLRTATTLDDFFDSVPAGSARAMTAQQTNFRLVGQRAQSNDMWRWAELSKKKRERSRAKGAMRSAIGSSVRSNGVGSRHFGSSKQRLTIPSKDTSGSVQTAAAQLRNSRYRSQRRAYPFQRHQPARMTARSAPSLPNSFEPIEMSSSVQSKKPHEHDEQSRVSNTTAGSAGVNLEAVFGVLPDFSLDSIPPPDAQVSLLAFGHWITTRTVREQLQSTDFVLTQDEVALRASRLRQRLTDLRQQEFDVLVALPNGVEDHEEGDVERAPAWLALTALGDAYHHDIAAFCADAVNSFKTVEPKDALNILGVVLQELFQSLRQLPDCESLFVGCQEYFFYFDVEAQNAKTTPLLSAVTRTYWYVLQMLTAVERDCEFPGQLKKSVRNLLIPARDWIARAAMLFLFDWYLYLPSSHVYPDDTISAHRDAQGTETPSDAPALSLWLLLFRCFRGDNETSPVAAEGKMQFWASLKTLYCDDHITNLSRRFIRGESSGGYLINAPQPTLRPNDKAMDEESMQIKLLGLDSTWDVLVVLIGLLEDGSAQDTTTTDHESQWEIVRHLLHLENRYFLPFSVPANASAQDHTRHFRPHAVRTLERVLTVSKTFSSDAATLQAIVQQVLDSAEPRQGVSIYQLPQFFRSFIAERSRARIAPTSSALLQFMSDSSSGHDQLGVLCQIVLTQLGRHEKPIARRRFRQPIFQVIQEALKATDTLEASTDHTSGSWGWGEKKPMSGTQTATAISTSPSKSSSHQVNLAKKRICISVLLTFALDSLDLGARNNSIGIEANKGRKREVEFYCKEIVRVGDEGSKPECTVMVSQALYVMGTGLVKVSVEYPEIFEQLNKLLTLSVEAAMKESREIPGWSELLHDGEEQHRTIYTLTSSDLREHEQRFRVVQGAVLSSLHLLRDLTSELCASIAEVRTVRSASEAEAAKTAYASIINSGLSGCFTAAVEDQKTSKAGGDQNEQVISVEDLNIAIEILHIVIPRCKDEPTRSKRVIPIDDQIQEAIEDDIYANMDVDALTGQPSSMSMALTLDQLRPHAVELVGKHLRKVLQKLVFRYPQPGSFQELFVIDLLGMIISTGEVPFNWSHVTMASMQSRFVASRLFSAAIKYSPEQEWLSSSFLSSQANSDQDLANLWMMATVNTSTLDPTPVTFKGNKVTFSIACDFPTEEEVKAQPAHQIRDSNCWVMLTDGIVYNILRKDNQAVRTKMHPLLFDLLHRVAVTCQLPRQLWLDQAAIVDASKLYALHLDMFHAFAKGTGDMWRSFNSNQAAHRGDIQKLRSIMAGIFPTFLKAYEINLRNSCMAIAATGKRPEVVLDKFMSAFAPETGKSFHDVDDAIGHEAPSRVEYQEVRTLITMFRFLYQCVDMLFFYCGDMAIGHDNLFTTTLERLFRQAVTAEYTHAQSRLGVKTPAPHNKLKARSAKRDDPFQGCESYVVTFVHNIQLFFARQKYPALLHWFASTSRTYLTFTPAGWRSSHLRTLLVNALDPEGTLGIHSYYPMSDGNAGRKQRFDVKNVRREVFYLACGLFVCQCTDSFEHCKAAHGEASTARSHSAVRQMRSFLLREFVRESVEFASAKPGTIDEALLPLLQFLRAVLNHVNLNRRRGRPPTGGRNGSLDAATCDFDMQEIHASLEWVTLYVARVLPPDEAIQHPLRTVLLIEYCGIVREAVEAAQDVRVDESTTRLLHLALDIVKSAQNALTKTSAPLDSAPSHRGCSSARLAEHLHAFDSHASTCAGFKMAWIDRAERESKTQNASTPQAPSFVIDPSRARADLLVAVRHVLELEQNMSNDVGGSTSNADIDGFSTTLAGRRGSS